jgi:hypothetical protein
MSNGCVFCVAAFWEAVTVVVNDQEELEARKKLAAKNDANQKQAVAMVMNYWTRSGARRRAELAKSTVYQVDERPGTKAALECCDKCATGRFKNWRFETADTLERDDRAMPPRRQRSPGQKRRARSGTPGTTTAVGMIPGCAICFQTS